jgi:hypothetical protein
MKTNKIKQTVWKCETCAINPCTLKMVEKTVKPSKCPYGLEMHIAKWEDVTTVGERREAL